MYSVYLKDWMEIFPMEQFLVLKAEDHYSDRRVTLAQTFAFLDLEQPTSFGVYMAKVVRNEGVFKGATPEPMMPETRDMLNELFKPMKDELAAMFNDTRFLWKD